MVLDSQAGEHEWYGDYNRRELVRFSQCLGLSKYFVLIEDGKHNTTSIEKGLAGFGEGRGRGIAKSR